MATQHPPRPITDVLSILGVQIQRLVRTEYQIARAEISENLGIVRGGLRLLVVGILLLIPALTIVMAGFVMALVQVGLRADLSALAIGGAALLVGVALLLSGLNRIKSAHLVPDKALDQLHRDVVAVNPMRHTHEHSAA